MSREEILLQDSLQAIENGASVDAVLKRLPEKDQDLAELIRIAQALSVVEHPQVNASAMQAARRRMLSSVGVKQESPAWRLPIPQLPRIFVPLARVSLVALLIIGVALIGVRFYQAGPIAARAATMINVTGLVEAGSVSDPSGWNTVNNGDEVKAGQALHTDTASTVTLVFSDGCRVIVGPNTDLTFTHLSGGYDGTLNGALTLEKGSISNDVAALKGPSSTFVVQTPAGSATVRGTQFSVLVTPDGETRYSVSRGQVLVQDNQGQMALNAGQVILSKLGEKSTSPAYEFTLQGILSSRSGNIWNINGLQIQVTSETWLNGSIESGLSIQVLGRIQPDNSWVADTVTPVDDQTAVLSFAGSVESQGDTDWVVSGRTVQVDRNTQISDGIKVNDPVRVYFTRQADGSFLAIRLLALNGSSGSNARLHLGFEPNGQVENSCSDISQLMTVVSNAANQAGDAARSVELTYVVEDGAQYIQDILLTPQMIDVLPPGSSTPIIITVSHSPAWDTASEGAKIRLQVFVAEDLGPASTPSAPLELVINRNCTIPTETTTPPAPVNAPTPEEIAICESQPSAQAISLATDYGATPGDVMSFFCKGYNYGEVQLAYSLAQAYPAYTPGEILAMRDSGMSWGAIKHLLAGDNKGGNKNKNNK